MTIMNSFPFRRTVRGRQAHRRRHFRRNIRMQIPTSVFPMTKAIALFFILILITHFAFAQEKQKEQSDEEIGARTFQIVKESMGIYKNGSVLKEVTSVGRSLEKFLGLTRPLKYFLVDSSEPNAFA